MHFGDRRHGFSKLTISMFFWVTMIICAWQSCDELELSRMYLSLSLMIPWFFIRDVPTHVKVPKVCQQKTVQNIIMPLSCLPPIVLHYSIPLLFPHGPVLLFLSGPVLMLMWWLLVLSAVDSWYVSHKNKKYGDFCFFIFLKHHLCFSCTEHYELPFQGKH